jgi:hypothetical protein
VVKILDNHLTTTQPIMEATGVAVEDDHGNRWNLRQTGDGLELRLIETGRGMLSGVVVRPVSANTIKVAPA